MTLPKRVSAKFMMSDYTHISFSRFVLTPKGWYDYRKKREILKPQRGDILLDLMILYVMPLKVYEWKNLL